MSALRTADNDPKSYLGLPPELRLLIYRQLVIFDSPTTGCCATVLRLCRQVHDEAIAVLEDENTVHIRVYLNGVVIQARDATICHPALDQSIEHLLWPLALRNVQRLHLSFAINPRQEPTESWEMSRTLYSLCAFLAGRHQCKHFELDLRYLYRPVPDSDADALLWPLQMLGPLDSLIVTFSATNTLRRANAALSTKGHHGDALTPALTIVSEAEIYMALENMARSSDRLREIRHHNPTNLLHRDCLRDGLVHLKRLIRSRRDHEFYSER